MNNELEISWMEVVVAYHDTVLAFRLPRGTEETPTKQLGQDSLHYDQDGN